MLYTFFCYFRSAVSLFLMGLAACGVWLVPVYMLGNGFVLAYCVRCFSVSLGKSGVLLAFAAFGIRCLFVLPCCFFLASRSWASSGRMQRAVSIREEKSANRSGAFPLLICLVVLLIGCVVEISLVPRLFSLILQRCF